MNLSHRSLDIVDYFATSQVRFGIAPAFLYRRNPESGLLEGFAIELAKSIAADLALGHDFVEYLDPHQLADGLNTGSCDIALVIGIDAKRAEQVDFSPPYLKADYTFMVSPGSSCLDVSEVDRPGHRVAVVRNHRMDSELRGKLLQAEYVFFDTPDESFAQLRDGGVNVAAGIRPGLLKYAQQLPGSRVLSGAYGENRLAMAVTKGNGRLRVYLADFVYAARQSGLLRDLAERTGLSAELVEFKD
ncbi:transporter substrate-binding domain-containing protein [Devosia sp. A369]